VVDVVQQQQHPLLLHELSQAQQQQPAVFVLVVLPQLPQQVLQPVPQLPRAAAVKVEGDAGCACEGAAQLVEHKVCQGGLAAPTCSGAVAAATAAAAAAAMAAAARTGTAPTKHSFTP